MAYHPVIRDIGLTQRDTLALEVDYYASETAYLAGQPPVCTDDAVIQCPAVERRALLNVQGRVTGYETVPYDVEGEIQRTVARFAAKKHQLGLAGDRRSERVRQRALWVDEYDSAGVPTRLERDPDGMLLRPGLRALRVRR